MLFIPTGYLLFWLFVFGSIIGSFLGVVSYRLHTSRSLSGHSHCETCAHGLRWYELVPIVSYIVLQGRCRACGSHIPLRHVSVELMTATLFALTGYLTFTGDVLLLALNLILVSLLMVIVVYDMRHYIIPDELVLCLCVLASLIVGKTALAGEWQPVLLSAAVGALVTSGFYALLWLITRGRGMGFGDVKLAAPLGALVGGMGAVTLVIFSFWIGAAVSIAILGAQRLRAIGYAHASVAKTGRYFTMKSEVPFAPFIIAAFLLVYMMHVQVFSLTTYALSTFSLF